MYKSSDIDFCAAFDIQSLADNLIKGFNNGADTFFGFAFVGIYIIPYILLKIYHYRKLKGKKIPDCFSIIMYFAYPLCILSNLIALMWIQNFSLSCFDNIVNLLESGIPMNGNWLRSFIKKGFIYCFVAAIILIVCGTNSFYNSLCDL